jgi:hypothetical protein
MRGNSHNYVFGTAARFVVAGDNQVTGRVAGAFRLAGRCSYPALCRSAGHRAESYLSCAAVAGFLYS